MGGEPRDRSSADIAGAEELIRECKRLCEESARYRTESIRARIMAARALCEVAETRLQWGSRVETETILAKLHRRVAEIDFHLREPGHIPISATGELRNLLMGLEAKLQRIEKRLNGPDPAGTA